MHERRNPWRICNDYNHFVHWLLVAFIFVIFLKLYYLKACFVFPLLQKFIQCACITGAKLRRFNSNLTNPQIMTIMAKQFQSGSASFANFSSPFNVTGRPFGSANASLNHEAAAGFCDRNCKNLKLFLFCSFLLILVVFLSVTPQKIAVLRYTQCC